MPRGVIPVRVAIELQLLGDALIGLFVAEYLFEKMPITSEGDLTVRRSHAVRGEVLAAAFAKFQDFLAACAAGHLLILLEAFRPRRGGAGRER